MTSTRRKKLGKELTSILDGASFQSGGEEASRNERMLQDVMVHKIFPGKYQPRRNFDKGSLLELAASISSQGLLQPITVRKRGGNEYEIIAGERRWRAAQIAGIQTIPVIIHDMSDESAMAFGLIENIQREGLNPIEEAEALQRLVQEFGLTHEQVAKAVGRSRAAISNSLRLLSAQDEVKSSLEDGSLEVGHARALLSLDPAQQKETAQQIKEKNLTVRASEKLVRELKASRFGGFPECEDSAFEIEKKLSSVYPSALFKISISKGNKPRIVVDFSDMDKLGEFVEEICSIKD